MVEAKNEAWWFSSKALRGQMQSFAWTDAKLCVGDCKALHWRMQCFARTDAKLCSEIGKTGTEIVSPILDKRNSPILDKKNGGKTQHTSHCSPLEISAEPENNQCACGIARKLK